MSAAGVLQGLLAFRRLDELARGDSPVHRLDARAKVLVTLGYVAVVMSYGRHEVAALVAFAVFPVAVVALGQLPLGWLLRKLAYVLPVALIVGLPNLLFDREVLLHWGGLDITGGGLSVLAIVLRTLLATAAALLLVAVTGMPDLCRALGRLGLPQALVVQLLLLYRYLAVLAEEALQMTLARELRGNGQALPLRQAGPLLGSLLLRTWARAERIHLAMRARGFDGQLVLPGGRRLQRADWFWLLGWGGLFALLRTHDLAGAMGRAALLAGG